MAEPDEGPHSWRLNRGWPSIWIEVARMVAERSGDGVAMLDISFNRHRGWQALTRPVVLSNTGGPESRSFAMI